MAPISILIVGCGIAGPTLASFLLLSPTPAQDKPRITIVERSTHRSRGQNVDIREAGVEVIRKLGLEATIRSSTTREEGAQMVDAQNRVRAAFAADKTGKVQTGTSDIEILRGRLAQICYNRCQTISDEVERQGGTAVRFIFGDYLDDLQQEVGSGVRVRFAKSGLEENFDLVVAADGLYSPTRSMAFGKAGEDQRVESLGMYGGFFSLPATETDTLWRRWYHAPEGRAIMLRPSDCSDISTVFLYVINDRDQRFKDVAHSSHGSSDAQKALFQEYFQDAGWESGRVLKQMWAADDFYYASIAQVRMEKWSRGQVVLLGDSAWCSSPISGMGTTLALVGAYHLAGALKQNSSDLETALRQYETAMRPDVARAQKLTPGMPNLMAPRTAFGIWVLRTVCAFLSWPGLAKLFEKVIPSRGGRVQLVDYGFTNPS